MLDENLPTFFLKPSADQAKHHEAFYFTQNGSEPDAQYALHHVDPASNAAKNTYAVALFDRHSPDILYGEVLAKPGWSHPTLSQDEIRRNGGVPPPPQPIFPTEFAIQLYNPDSQVVVRQQTAKWSSAASWEFSIPQVSFRTPSNSDLDRTQNDPAADASAPRVNFAWRREGRLGKDMTCYMTGKSTDPTGKRAKRSKEPDIAVALFSGLKEMTIMEPNLYRVEIEDYKGLEVVLLIAAAVIRDLFFSDPHEQFHISDAAVRKNSGGLRARKGSSPLEGPGITPPVMTPQPPPPPVYSGPSQYPPEKVPLQPARDPAANARPPLPAYMNNNAAKRSSLPPLATNHARPIPPQLQPGRQQQQQQQLQQQQRQQQQQQQQRPPQPPRLDPRAQWEIDAETARLKAQVEAEEREQKRQAEVARKARRKQEEEEERKTLQFLEQERKQKDREEKERRRKQAEVDKETERLKKQFGDQSNLLRPSPPQQRHSVAFMPGPWQTQRPIIQQPPRPVSRPAPIPMQPPRIQGQAAFLQAPYLQPGGHRPTASHSSFFGNGLPTPQDQPKPKKSFWGLRTQSESNSEKLKKKKSSMF